jgi:hypothetical protein
MSCCDEPHGPADHKHKKKATARIPFEEVDEEVILGQSEEERLRLR